MVKEEIDDAGNRTEYNPERDQEDRGPVMTMILIGRQAPPPMTRQK